MCDTDRVLRLVVQRVDSHRLLLMSVVLADALIQRMCAGQVAGITSQLLCGGVLAKEHASGIKEGDRITDGTESCGEPFDERCLSFPFCMEFPGFRFDLLFDSLQTGQFGFS